MRGDEPRLVVESGVLPPHSKVGVSALTEHGSGPDVLHAVSVLRPSTPWRIVLVLTAWIAFAEIGVANEVREALRESLPKYDPSIRERAIAVEAAAAEAASPVGSGPKDNVPEVPKRKTVDGAVQLPEVVVEAQREPGRPLPRMHRDAPKAHVTIEPFASPAEQDRLLVKRHMSPLDQAMNRFTLPLFGTSLASRARHAEARLRYAQQLDQLAAMIAHLERQDAPKAEIEKMRALYMDLYLARP